MTDFETGSLEQIGTPISNEGGPTSLSRSDSVGVIVASLVNLRIYPESNELYDVIEDKVEQFEVARGVDIKPGDPDVAVRYGIDLDPKVLTADSLLARYRAMGHKAHDPWELLWSQFSDAELNKRRPDEVVAEPKVPFQGRVVGWLQGGDHPTEAGLYLTGKTWTEQQQMAKKKIEDYATSGRQRTGLWLSAFGDFVLAHAAEAEARDGVTLDATNTFSRMVQHDMKSVGDHDFYGPIVDSYGGELDADGSNVHADPGGGVRFLLGQTEA